MAKDYTNIDFSNKNSKLQFEMFPEELTQLRIEIDNHPELLLILHTQADKDVYIQISEIAAYCGIVLEGMYTRDDIITLCKLCLDKLISKRTLILI